MITRTIAIHSKNDNLLWAFAQQQRINLHLQKQIKDENGKPTANIYSCTADPEVITLLAIHVPLSGS